MRRFEEDMLGPGYLERLRALGPRDGESIVAFEMRLAAITRGREVLANAIYKGRGETSEVYDLLGIQATNIANLRRRLGIDSEQWLRALHRGAKRKKIDFEKRGM